jgi:hypothetical protein
LLKKKLRNIVKITGLLKTLRMKKWLNYKKANVKWNKLFSLKIVKIAQLWLAPKLKVLLLANVKKSIWLLKYAKYFINDFKIYKFNNRVWFQVLNVFLVQKLKYIFKNSNKILK